MFIKIILSIVKVAATPKPPTKIQINPKSVEVVDFPELGMEAVRKIEIENFPAFIICDDKGNDFFAEI